MEFKIFSSFDPAGGQPEAIKKLVDGYGVYSKQTLLGITGSGKTHVMARTIEKLQKPTLILAHNKTLAAQLYSEIKELFPENRVEYFISYYDYYQPESYVPTTDTFIEKEVQINEEIEKMKLRAMSSILSRDDVIIVSSISCIYGAGNPKDFQDLSIELKVGDEVPRSKIISDLVYMLYERNDYNLERGKFRVKGDVIDLVPGYEENIIRTELFGDEIEKITELDPINKEKITSLDKISIYPAKQFVVPEEKQNRAIDLIKKELEERVKELPMLEAERLKKRVKYDIEMIEEVGYCTGIENYSRYFDDRKPGEPPYTLLDYFPEDFLLIIDESHQTIPQAKAMYRGDFSRKKNLVDFGFRLPSAFDNRPLTFEEFEKYFKNTIFVSATPGEYELENSENVVELIIRPTGLLDPIVEVKPTKGQMNVLVSEVRDIVSKNERVLVTTLTKRMAEDLTNYLIQQGIKVRYMHSDIDSLERIEIVKGLREGEFDVLVGINLLREGLDIPEVSLVAILDADKEGFLRNERSLIQTMGRAARNENGRVIMFADNKTLAMRNAIEKTKYRRKKQEEFNEKYGITPKTIRKKLESRNPKYTKENKKSKEKMKKEIIELESEMKKASENLDFETAIELRDKIENLKKKVGED